MKIVDLSKQNTILNKFVSQLRDITVQNDSMRFRRNVERIGEIMAYEISRELEYVTSTVKTPLSNSVQNVPADNIVLATILRAGLPLHTGFHNIFDDAENAFVSAYRKYIDDSHFDVQIEYLASPRLEGKTVLLVDTMLATGSSLVLAYNKLCELGEPEHTHIVCPIASEFSLGYLSKHLP
ncbi:MAG: uracil phosphoribosyltransferase, partial [Bacteroidaceae bacterium]|nr:uracil phosphoribosyltransferase [Bacteroidaceae bacterium]